MIKSEQVIQGQKLKVNLAAIKDRLPKNIVKQLNMDPYGKLVGYKMVDGNAFGLVLELSDGSTSWFFENELSEIIEE